MCVTGDYPGPLCYRLREAMISFERSIMKEAMIGFERSIMKEVMIGFKRSTMP